MVRNHVTTLDEKSPVRAVSEQEDEEVAALVRDESNQSKPYFTALFNSFRNKAANLLRHPKAPLYLPILLAFGLLLMGKFFLVLVLGLFFDRCFAHNGSWERPCIAVQSNKKTNKF